MTATKLKEIVSRGAIQHGPRYFPHYLHHTSVSRPIPAWDPYEQLVASAKAKTQYINTGVEEFNKILGGLPIGGITTIVGGPGSGKSLLARSLWTSRRKSCIARDELNSMCWPGFEYYLVSRDGILVEDMNALDELSEACAYIDIGLDGRCSRFRSINALVNKLVEVARRNEASVLCVAPICRQPIGQTATTIEFPSVSVNMISDAVIIVEQIKTGPQWMTKATVLKSRNGAEGKSFMLPTADNFAQRILAGENA
jgi:hypothetical protein